MVKCPNFNSCGCGAHPRLNLTAAVAAMMHWYQHTLVPACRTGPGHQAHDCLR